MAQYSNIHRPDVSFVWNITDVVLRDTFKKSEIGDVILPFVVLQRMDCILEPYNKAVRATYEQFKDKISLEKLDPLLRKTAGELKFYNTSRHTLVSLLDDAKNIARTSPTTWQASTLRYVPSLLASNLTRSWRGSTVITSSTA